MDSLPTIENDGGNDTNENIRFSGDFDVDVPKLTANVAVGAEAAAEVGAEVEDIIQKPNYQSDDIRHGVDVRSDIGNGVEVRSDIQQPDQPLQGFSPDKYDRPQFRTGHDVDTSNQTDLTISSEINNELNQSANQGSNDEQGSEPKGKQNFTIKAGVDQ